MTKRSTESDRDLSIRPANEWDRLWADVEPKDALPMWNDARSLRVLEQFSRSALNPHNGLITHDVLEYVLRPFVSSPLLVLCGVGTQISAGETWAIPTGAESSLEWEYFQSTPVIRGSYIIAQQEVPILYTYGRHHSFIKSLDVHDGSWSAVGCDFYSLPVHHNLCSLGDSAFLCGGANVTLDNEWGDFATRSTDRSFVLRPHFGVHLAQRECAVMPYSVMRGGCVALDNSTVMVAGGFSQDVGACAGSRELAFDSILTYNAHADRWSALDSKLTHRMAGRAFLLAENAALMISDKMYTTDAVMNLIDIRCSSTATLLEPAGFSEQISSIVSAALGDHCVLFIGGSPRLPSRSIFIFDGRANRVYPEDRLWLSFANPHCSRDTSAVVIRA